MGLCYSHLRELIGGKRLRCSQEVIFFFLAEIRRLVVVMGLCPDVPSKLIGGSFQKWLDLGCMITKLV